MMMGSSMSLTAEKTHLDQHRSLALYFISLFHYLSKQPMYFSKNCRLGVNVYKKKHKIMYIIWSLVFPFFFSGNLLSVLPSQQTWLCIFDVFHSISRHHMMPWGHMVVTNAKLHHVTNTVGAGWGRPMMLRKSPTLSLTVVGPCCIVLIFTLSILILFLCLNFI